MAKQGKPKDPGAKPAAAAAAPAARSPEAAPDEPPSGGGTGTGGGGGGAEPSSGGLAALAPFAPIALALLAGDEPLDKYREVKQALRDFVDDDPMDAMVAAVLGGGLAFYLAERDTNPTCATPWDGMLFMATCLSGGCDPNAPTTVAGHAVAALVQTFGLGLSVKAYDLPKAAKARAEALEAAARDDAADVNRQILARLEDIVRLLEAKA